MLATFRQQIAPGAFTTLLTQVSYWVMETIWNRPAQPVSDQRKLWAVTLQSMVKDGWLGVRKAMEWEALLVTRESDDPRRRDENLADQVQNLINPEDSRGHDNAEAELVREEALTSTSSAVENVDETGSSKSNSFSGRGAAHIECRYCDLVAISGHVLRASATH